MTSVRNGPWNSRNITNSSMGPLDNGGGPPDDPRMEERVKNLEDLVNKTVERIVNIERDMAVVRSNYASKEDLHKELHATTWKIIGAVAVLCAAVFWMARNIQPPAAAPQAAAPATTSSVAPAVKH